MCVFVCLSELSCLNNNWCTNTNLGKVSWQISTMPFPMLNFHRQVFKCGPHLICLRGLNTKNDYTIKNMSSHSVHCMCSSGGLYKLRAARYLSTCLIHSVQEFLVIMDDNAFILVHVRHPGGIATLNTITTTISHTYTVTVILFKLYKSNSSIIFPKGILQCLL